MLRTHLILALCLSLWLTATGILAPCVSLLCAEESPAAATEDSASQSPCIHSDSDAATPLVAAAISNCCSMEIASSPEALTAKKPAFAPDLASSAVRESPAAAGIASALAHLAPSTSHPLFLPNERQPLLCVFLI